MNLLKNGYRRVSTASVPISEETFRLYIQSDFQLYFNKERGAYALGLDSSSEEVNEYIGSTQEEAGEWLNEFFNNIERDKEE